MVRKLFWFLVLLSTAAHADVMEDAHSATARIRAADGSTGTGTAFERSQGYLWLVTCAHVATSPQMSVEWFYQGHQSGAVQGVVRWRDVERDVAVIAVPEASLGGVIPPVIPFAPPNHLVQAGRAVYTVGSANGTWPTGVEGHAIAYTHQGLTYIPPPANGRSGSAMIDETGRIVGVVRARSEETGGYGIATPVQAMYALWGDAQQRRTAVQTAVTVPWRPAVPVQERFRYRLPLPGVQQRQYRDGFSDGSQCGPQGCPIPQQQQQTGPLGGNLWPTLPIGPQAPQGVAPVAPQLPALDLSPIADAIRGPPEEAELRRRSLTAEAEYYEGMTARAEAEQHRELIDAVPLAQIGDAGVAAISRDWGGVVDAGTSDPMLGWLGTIIVWVLTGLVGITGIPALLIRFGVPFGLKIIGSRLRAGFHTEADDVADEIATRAAAKVAANGTAKP